MEKSLVIFCLFVCISDDVILLYQGYCAGANLWHVTLPTSTYNNTIKRIIATNCTQLGGCHNPATGLGSSSGVTANDLTTLSGVKS